MRYLAIILFILLFSQVEAQTIGDFRPIAALTYGFKVEGIGINIGAEYLALDNFGIAGTYEHFFTDNTVTFNSYHVDGRYYFRGGQLQYYGLIGYVRNNVQFRNREKTSKGGVNLGIGTVYRLSFSDRIALFGQLRYSTPNQSQFAAFGGITYLLNLK